MTLPGGLDAGGMGDTPNTEDPVIGGTVSVEFETKEGSGRFDKDLTYCKGVLVSHQNNCHIHKRNN